MIFPHPGLQHSVGVAPLARDRVTFVGKPVAGGRGRASSLAADALELIREDWTPRPRSWT